MKLKFFVILLLLGTVCLAQDKVVFDYDKSGNMTSRQVVYLVIDEGYDYHWYRQDKGGLWSQKHGWDNVDNIDGSKKIIRNPIKANHHYVFGNFTVNYKDGGILLWVKGK